MRRIKVLLNTTAILVAIVAALATRYYIKDQDEPQYIHINNTYQPAGEYGVDYNCYRAEEGVCTYYLADSINQPGEFLPARKGLYKAVEK
jgi:hypothetical protein